MADRMANRCDRRMLRPCGCLTISHVGARLLEADAAHPYWHRAHPDVFLLRCGQRNVHGILAHHRAPVPGRQAGTIMSNCLSARRMLGVQQLHELSQINTA